MHMTRTLALFISATIAYGPIAAMAEAQSGPAPKSRQAVWVRRGPSTTTSSTTSTSNSNTGSTGWNRIINRKTTDVVTTTTNNTTNSGTNGSGTTSTTGGSVTNTGTDGSAALNPEPAAAPSVLAGVSMGNGRSVTLSWVDNSTSETLFEITRETEVSGIFGSTVIRGAAANATSYVDNPGVGSYRYRIRAMDTFGGSALTDWVPVTVNEVAPFMPQGLQAADMRNGRDAWIAWSDMSTNETGFEITRETQSGINWINTTTIAVPANSTSYVDAAGVGVFRYQVRAVNSAGASPTTVWLSPTIADVAPAAPGDIATTDLGNRTQVLVSWSDLSTNESGFQVERETNTSGIWGSATILSAGLNATSLIDSPGLGQYRYHVRASNGVGQSNYSSWSQVTVAEIIPAVPGTASATDLGNRSQVRVQWADNSDNETGFTVIRETLAGSTWGSSVGMNAAANATSLIDSPGLGTYRYRVAATNSAGNSAATSFAQVTVAEISPSAPSALAAASLNNGSQVNLTWTDGSNNETSFEITRQTQSGSTWGSLVTLNAAPNAGSLTDAPGIGTFRYRMRAVNTAGSSAYTAYAQVTVSAAAPTVPAAPSSLAVLDNTDGTANLTWADNSDNETGFQIERTPAFASAQTVGSNITTMVDAPGAGDFMYRLRAINGGGNSSWTSWVSVSVTDVPPGGGTGGTGGTGTGGTGGSGGGGGTETGWTTYAIASDARAVYVSSSAGNNANAGTISAPVRSLAAGYALLRDGYPDHMLLKRGDTWDEALPSWKKSGRSATEPIVVEAYGDESIDRPLLRTGSASGFRREPGGGAAASINNVAIMNVYFWANTAGNGGDVGFWWLGGGQNVRVEDCMFQDYSFGMTLQGYTGTLTNFTLHRNVIVDSHSSGSHAEGIYATQYNGMTVTENILDKNGWKAGTAATPNMFNHNAYFDMIGDNLTFSRNIVSDGSSHGVQLRPGATAEDNLFMKNPIGMQIGFGGLDAGADTDPSHPQMAYVRRNVFLMGRDIDANNPRGWAIIAEWLRGGEIVDNIAVGGGGNYRKDLIISDTGGGSSNGGVQNVSIARNIWQNWGGDIDVNGNSSELRNVTFTGNIVNDSASISPLFNHNFAASSAGFTGGNNVYYTGAGQNGFADVAGSSKSLTQWKSAIGDTTSTFAASTFPNANASITGYMTSASITGTYDSFMARARQQRKGNWDVKYQADTIGAWFRTQFGR